MERPVETPDLDELKKIIDRYRIQILQFEDETNAETEWEEVHYALSCYNWDDGIEFPRALIYHPDCDRGTALLLFWRFSPDSYTHYQREDPESADSAAREKFTLLVRLMEKYESGFYTEESICFDPADDFGYNWPSELKEKERKWEIPQVMMRPTSGKKIKSKLDELDEMMDEFV
jgi:hypothetical protein